MLYIYRLYISSNWRRHIGDIVSDDYKKFNWYLCGQRYFDKKSNHYAIKIPSGTKFYCEDNGKTYTLPYGTADEKIDYNILILEESPDENILNKTKDFYGYAFIKKCPENSYMSPIYHEVFFIFSKKGLMIEEDNYYYMITYSKQYNSCIRTKYSKFPTCEEIEQMIQKYPLNVVTKKLYRFFQLFEELSDRRERSEIERPKGTK